ncbi:MAG: SDR family NAD(P)-dependent oxidoreductase [Paracoccaceae bacterium]|nr:SDR family NAD(P)-dependent oxidoreductase [Paracoccaceae bacterium]
MKREFQGKTYWIVGASEGLGRALAKELHQVGANLILSARSQERLDQLCSELDGALALPMDVTDPVSVTTAVERAGNVDGIVYCVGLYEPMTAANWQPAEAEAMCEANFMGAVRILGRTVPGMIARDNGHLVLVGSLAGHRGLPGAIGYGASKAALMHLAETILADTRGTGVSVQVANPGFIRTRLTDKNAFKMPMIMTPEEAAQQVLKHMRGARFRIDFPKPFAWLFTKGKFLPERIFYAIMGGSNGNKV